MDEIEALFDDVTPQHLLPPSELRGVDLALGLVLDLP